MKGFIFGFILAASLVSGAWLWNEQRPVAKEGIVKKEEAPKYHCPMHPTYVSDKPGDCPICGMKLVPMEEDPASSTQESHGGHGGASSAKADEQSPEGYSPVQISADKLQLMGVTTAEAKDMELGQSIRTTGRVAPDETRLHHVHTKFEGYIEKIFVNYVGQFVKKGDPLFSIYSPELLATQREYLLALKARENLGNSNESLGLDLLESARQRLALWDISQQQIADLERTRTPLKALIVRSPVSGYVTAKMAIQGTRIMPSDTLYDIVDLSRVWVMADVYEVNASLVKIGTPVTVELPYQQYKKIEGTITYIDPVVDPMSRTLKARIEVANPGNLLKPDMFANVILGGTTTTGLVVPEDAVIATGERLIVFVEVDKGNFQPREVIAGAKVRGFYEIKSGVAAGERVVTSGNFLLDSESKLRASISGSGAQHQH